MTDMNNFDICIFEECGQYLSGREHRHGLKSGLDSRRSRVAEGHEGRVFPSH